MHFCGNPGITPRIKQKIAKIFEIKGFLPTKSNVNQPAGMGLDDEVDQKKKSPVSFLPKPSADKIPFEVK